MEKTFTQRNHDNWKKALRKQKIVQSWQSGDFGEYYPTLHQYMDNKIHCSCPLCRCKTTNKGKHAAKYVPTYNPPIHDIKQLNEMDDQLKDVDYE